MTNKQQKHTELPWILVKNSWAISTIYDAEKQNIIADLVINNTSQQKVNEANAEFIVRAVNNHYKLVEALEIVRLELERITISTQTTALGRNNGLRLRKECCEIIDQALKAAEGK